jgi:hypothetical protein
MCSDHITFQNAIDGKTQLWELRPLVPAGQRKFSASCRHFSFSTLNIQLNSNYVFYNQDI